MPGGTFVAAVGPEIFRLEQWREKAIAGIDASLKERKGDPVKAELDIAMKRIGELIMQVELLEAKRRRPALWGGGGRGDECRHLSRHGFGLRMIQRVCAAWGFARSSFYAMKSRQQATAERPPAKRRGPKPSISDEALLVAIEADLEASPWEGEGHRKVWARLRVCRGIRVSRKRACSG